MTKYKTIRKDRIQDNWLKTLKPEEQRYEVTEPGGLVVMIHPGGTKTFYYRYQFRKRQRRLLIGIYGPISLAEARAKKEAWEVVRKGGKDPAHFSTLSCPSVEEALEAYLGDLEREQKRSGGKKGQGTIANHLKAKSELLQNYGSWCLADLTRPIVKNYLKGIADRAFTSANRMLYLLSGIFDYALDNEYPGVAGNPLSGMKPFARPENKPALHRTLSMEEIGAIWRYIHSEDCPMPQEPRDIIRFQLISGCRHNEPAGLHVDEFNLDRELWELPKIRDKNNVGRQVYMTHTMRQIYIEYAARAAGLEGEYAGRFFPRYWELERRVRNGENDKGSSELTNRAIRRAQKHADFPLAVENFSSHCLRGVWITIGTSIGVPEGIRQRCAGHSVVKVEGKHHAVYNRYPYELEKAAAYYAVERRLFVLAGMEPPQYSDRQAALFQAIIDNHYVMPGNIDEFFSAERVEGLAYDDAEQSESAESAEIECLQVMHEQVKPGRKLSDLSAEELKTLVWQKPAVQIGREFGISDVAVNKRCRVLGINRPGRGYWAQQRH